MNKIENLEDLYQQTKESKKLYLQKKLKKAENRLKKYIKEDNKTWAMMEQRRVWDLDEQLKELENE
jgi:hypothetical protein